MSTFVHGKYDSLHPGKSICLLIKSKKKINPKINYERNFKSTICVDCGYNYHLKRNILLITILYV